VSESTQGDFTPLVSYLTAAVRRTDVINIPKAKIDTAEETAIFRSMIALNILGILPKRKWRVLMINA